MHTQFENLGEGVPDVFLPKSLGGQGFQEKLPGGCPTILGFIAFLLTSVQKSVWGGYYIYPPLPLPPPHPLVCIYEPNLIKFLFFGWCVTSGRVLLVFRRTLGRYSLSVVSWAQFLSERPIKRTPQCAGNNVTQVSLKQDCEEALPRADRFG